jgi:hypothetical protein
MLTNFSIRVRLRRYKSSLCEADRVVMIHSDAGALNEGGNIMMALADHCSSHRKCCASWKVPF